MPCLAILGLNIWGLTIAYSDKYKEILDSNKEEYEKFNSIFLFMNWLAVSIAIAVATMICCFLGLVCVFLCCAAEQHLT